MQSGKRWGIVLVMAIGTMAIVLSSAWFMPVVTAQLPTEPGAKPTTKKPKPPKPRPPAPKPQPSAPKPQPPASKPEVRPQNVAIEFVDIPAGEFLMGSDNGEDDEKPVHRVSIKAFRMGKYEVTQEQWQAVMGSNPSYFKSCGGNCPVESVGWSDVQIFLQRLNARNDGYTYRLPTEAEWEYACRAGTTGDYAGELSLMAWYSDNSDSKPHPVGQKSPNRWGLYDMHGNVWEWCADWYGSYSSEAQTDPTGPATGSGRVVRGGGWGGNAASLRAADRGRSAPSGRRNDLGFRLVRTYN